MQMQTVFSLKKIQDPLQSSFPHWLGNSNRFFFNFISSKPSPNSCRFTRWTLTMPPSSTACHSRRRHPATRSCPWSAASFSTCFPSASSSAATWPCTASATASRRSSPTCRARRSTRSSPWSGLCWSSAGTTWVGLKKTALSSFFFLQNFRKGEILHLNNKYYSPWDWTATDLHPLE